MNLKTALIISLVAFCITLISFVAFIFTGILAVLGKSKMLASFFMLLLIISFSTTLLAPLCSLAEMGMKRVFPFAQKNPSIGYYLLIGTVIVIVSLIISLS